MILTVVWMRFGSGLGRFFNPGQFLVLIIFGSVFVPILDRFETFLSGWRQDRESQAGTG